MEKPLKHVKTKKQKVDISDKEKELIEKYKAFKETPEISNEEASILDILTKRKTLDQINREYNLSLIPLSKDKFTKEKILEILETLEKKDLVMKIDAPIGTVWVDKKEYREKARGTDKL